MNWKQFNDKYGHVEGDHLIIHFASLLRAHTRADDVLVRLGRRVPRGNAADALSGRRPEKGGRHLSCLLQEPLCRSGYSGVLCRRRALARQRANTGKSFGGPMKHCTLQKQRQGRVHAMEGSKRMLNTMTAWETLSTLCSAWF